MFIIVQADGRPLQDYFAAIPSLLTFDTREQVEHYIKITPGLEGATIETR